MSLQIQPGLVSTPSLTFGATSSAHESEEDLLQAERNFQRFAESGSQYVTAVRAKIKTYEAKVEQDATHTDEYQETKQALIQKYIDERNELRARVLSQRPFTPDLCENLRKQVLRGLTQPTMEKAFKPEHEDYWPAKILLFAISSGWSTEEKIKKLKELQQLLERLSSDSSVYLEESKESRFGGDVEYRVKESRFQPSTPKNIAQRQLLEEIKQAAQNGDIGAKVILWSRERESNLWHYSSLFEASKQIEEQLKRFILQWRKPIVLNGKELGVTRTNLVSVISAAQPHINRIKEKEDRLGKQYRVQGNLTEVVKKKALKEAKRIVEAMEACEVSRAMQAAAVEYEANKLKNTEKHLKDIEQNYPPLSPADAEVKFNSYNRSSLLLKLCFSKVEAYRQANFPVQLAVFSAMHRMETRKGMSFSPKKIVLVHPLFEERMRVTRGGFSGVTSTNKYGDLLLEFPEDNPRYFRDIKFIKKDGQEEYFELTEAGPDGYKETYTLVTNAENPAANAEGKFYAKIICKNGDEAVLEYGQPIPFSTVRKPIIAFRDFAEDTELTVSVDFSGTFQMVYPQAQQPHEQGLIWQGQATPQQTFRFQCKEYPYLFWDGNLHPDIHFHFETGYCIPRNQVVEFLEKQAGLAGLDNTLITDFVTFWVPYLQQNDYNLIRFLTPEECDTVARLHIIPQTALPIQIIRFYMIYKPVAQHLPLPAPVSSPYSISNQPKVIEWGGFLAQ